MSLYTELFDNAKTLVHPDSPDCVGTHRVIAMDLEAAQARHGDVPLPLNFQGRSEIQRINKFTGSVSGGNYKLIITLDTGEQAESMNIPYNMATLQISNAVNITCCNAWAWYEFDDIQATGGPLYLAPAVIGFVRDPVDRRNQPLVQIINVDLVGGDVNGVDVIQDGQSPRAALAAMFITGTISDTILPQKYTSPFSIVTTRQTNPFMLKEVTLRALAKEAAVQDSTPALENILLSKIGLKPLS